MQKTIKIFTIYHFCSECYPSNDFIHVWMNMVFLLFPSLGGRTAK